MNDTFRRSLSDQRDLVWKKATGKKSHSLPLCYGDDGKINFTVKSRYIMIYYKCEYKKDE